MSDKFYGYASKKDLRDAVLRSCKETAKWLRGETPKQDYNAWIENLKRVAEEVE